MTASNNEPKQKRSRLSQAKIVHATRELLAELGYDGLTLQLVSQVAGVSIGSIYGRFTGKDELVHFVHAELLEEMRANDAALVQDPRWQDLPLAVMVPELFDAIAETLRTNSPLLRAFMLRAISDPVISERGVTSYWEFVDKIVELLMTRVDELQCKDPASVFRYCLISSYSTYGNILGLGSNRGESKAADWAWIKRETASMVMAYLARQGMQAPQT